MMDYSTLFEDINWVAVVVAMVASMVWSFVWYSKSVMGDPWMKAVGVTEKQLQKAYMTRVMPVVVIMSFVGAFVLALVLRSVQGWVDGAVGGAIVGAGVASQLLVLYAFALRPRKLMQIDGVWVVANFVLMGLVLSLFD